MKSERVVSPAAVNGLVENTMVREGSPSSARLTLIRPARPTCCEPLAVIAPLYGAPLSVNNGSCGLPLVSDDIVVVTDADSTSERFGAPSSTTRRVEPDGFENCRSLDPSAALSWETTEAMPPEKLMPSTASFGSSGAVLRRC